MAESYIMPLSPSPETLQTRFTGHEVEIESALEEADRLLQLSVEKPYIEFLAVFGTNYRNNFQSTADEILASGGFEQVYALDEKVFDSPIALDPYAFQWLCEKKLTASIKEVPPTAITQMGVIACNMFSLNAERLSDGKFLPEISEPFVGLHVIPRS